MTDIFEASTDEIKKGYMFAPESGHWICAVCGREYENGEIFQRGGRFFDARKMAELHVGEEHGGMLAVLMAMEKRYTGLTENQKELLTLLHDGLGDREIAERTGTAASTVRHQRFMFREKMKQAKIFLAICELAFEGRHQGGGTPDRETDFMEIHRGATMVDERYMVTISEEEEIIKNMFSSLNPLKLKLLSPKEKKKIVILKRIAAEFQTDRRYSEKEINAVLQGIYEDFATVRRYLIEYGFMDRAKDGSEYWRKE